MLEMADRSKPMWFTGSAVGTAGESVVRSGHGWLDADKGAMHIAFSIELAAERQTKDASVRLQAA